MTDVSTFSAFELLPFPRNQMEGLPLYMSLVSLSILSLNLDLKTADSQTF